jgi:hypothetical protein
MFSIAKTSNFTNMFGTYGTAGANTFVIASEVANNTTFEFRSGVGIGGGLNLAGGTLLYQISNDGQIYAPRLLSNSECNILFFNSGSGRITYASPSVLSLPAAGSNTQITFNSSGVSSGNPALTFNYTSGTLNVSSLNVSNTTNMSGNLFMNLCNICNVGTEGFSKQTIRLLFSTPPLSTTVSGGYTYYAIGSDTSLEVVGGSVANVKYFAVGGGGGGGFNVGAGGGAGGLQTNDPNLSGIITLSQYNAGYITLCAASYSITVGSGGPGDPGTGGPAGSSGVNTTFSGTGITTITAVGGGGGGSYQGTGPHAGVDGGCGGGGSFTFGPDSGQPNPEPGGLGTQGYPGGSGNTIQYITGGGGGLGSAGGDAGAMSGNGGSAITYLNVSYGGGGGGGAGVGGSAGSGGGGGAGNGSYFNGGEPYLPGGDALSNTGSGGGGGGNGGWGGAGGSGIFILGVPTIQVEFGTVRIDQSLNMSINSSNNIALNPSSGGVTISGLSPAINNMTGFYNLVYNPTTGQLAYYMP